LAVFDDSRFVSFRFVGFAIGATQRPEVVEHDMHGDIKSWFTRCQWGLVTHDVIPQCQFNAGERQSVPIRTPRQRPDSRREGDTSAIRSTNDEITAFWDRSPILGAPVRTKLRTRTSLNTALIQPTPNVARGQIHGSPSYFSPQAAVCGGLALNDYFHLLAAFLTLESAHLAL
jgi:hypothetical protein